MADRFKDNTKEICISLGYDDVLILPTYSDISPGEVDLKIQLNKELYLGIPIMSAAMDTVTGYEMARAMVENGGVGVLHRNSSTEYLIETLQKLKHEFGGNSPIAIAVGTNSSETELKSFVEAGANILVVDSAHGHSKAVGELVTKIRSSFPTVLVIAGNVVTAEGALFLVEKGAHGVKVGIGPGSICITRMVTGVGRGQVSSIKEISTALQGTGTLVVADGGIRGIGDVMKSLAVGADMVMLGYMLAGADECPGDVVEIECKKYRYYRGMGSVSAMKAGSSNRYNKEGLSEFKLVPEGVEGYVSCKGGVKEILENIIWGLKSGFGYLGAKNLGDLKLKAKITQITASVGASSKVHSIEKVISVFDRKESV